jgi:transaldolase
VTTTRSEPLFDAVRTLSREGIKINMTAIFTPDAGRAGRGCARRRRAGLRVGVRRASCGFRRRLSPIMNDAIARARKTPNVEIIWASTREVFNVVEADSMGCHIITAPADVLLKLPALGTLSDAQLSLGAVKAFR